MGELTHGERRRQGLTCPPDSAPAPAEVLPRGPSEVEEEEEEEEGVGGKEEEEGELSWPAANLAAALPQVGNSLLSP